MKSIVVPNWLMLIARWARFLRLLFIRGSDIEYSTGIVTLKK